METEALIKREYARGIVFKRLAECYSPPGENLHACVEDLQRQLAILSSDALPQAALLQEAAAATSLQSLEVDYARLFVGPFSLPAAPYGSLYLEGKRRIMGNSTLNALGHYHAAGLGIAKGFMEVPDHIAVELEFMYFLILKEVDALYRGEPALVRERLGRQKRFMEGHLGLWTPMFAKALETAARTAFYLQLAVVTRSLVGECLAELAELPEPELSAGLGSGPEQKP